MKPTISVCMQGGFGNQLFQYAFARAYALSAGYDFVCSPWIGERIFQLDDQRPDSRHMERINETMALELLDRDWVLPGNIELRGYFQQQKALIYTRTMLREWFTLQPAVENFLHYRREPSWKVCAHRRVGDYPGYGYVIPSVASYKVAAHTFNLCETAAGITWVTEENPWRLPEMDGDLRFLPDFYRLMRAPVILRGNSTFSWWAATLGAGQIFAPVIESLASGEQHCHFVEGNWPKFANLDFITDLYLAP